MPEILAQPLSPTCYRLFPDPGIAEFQWLDPDPFLPARATRARATSLFRSAFGSCATDGAAPFARPGRPANQVDRL